MMERINIRVHNDYVVQASLHGIKVPPRFHPDRVKQEAEIEDAEFDPKIAERAMLAAQQRVKARYGR
jgi:hypothetical protein